MGSVELYATGVGTAVIVIGTVSVMAKDCRNKISGMYKRFDEHKRDLRDTHVSKEVHDLKYVQLKGDIDEIKGDVKQLLRKANGKSG